MNQTIIYRLAIIIAAIALFLGMFAGQRPALSAPTAILTVNSAIDNTDSDFELTLREAILIANGGTSANGLSRILSVFEAGQVSGCTLTAVRFGQLLMGYRIDGGCGAGVPDTIIFDTGIKQINLSDGLPPLNDNTTWIDGRDQNGTITRPRIDGSAMGGSTCVEAFLIGASNTTISNLVIVNVRPESQSPLAYCAAITVYSGKNNAIAFNHLGIVPAATNCSSGGVTRNASYGVYVAPNSSGSIGAQNGVVYIYGNRISCHTRSGIYIANSNWGQIGSDRENKPAGNYIGTTPDGSSPAGNGEAGIAVIGAAATRNFISNNVISGNTHEGVFMDGSYANDVSSNLIGLNAAGTAAIPNGLAGIAFVNSKGNWIYGFAEPQYISGNLREGIYLHNSTDILIDTNTIGLAKDDQLPIGNGREGILAVGGSTGIIRGNTISYNGRSGIALRDSSTRLRITPWKMYNNRGLPIDLGDDGPTLNDPADGDSGPNSLLNYPTLTAVNGQTITGSTCSNCEVLIYKAIGNPAAPGGGNSDYLQTVKADATGTWSATLLNGTAISAIALLASDPNGNASEYSPRPQVALPLIRR